MITPTINQNKPASQELSSKSQNREIHAPQTGIGRRIHTQKNEPTEWTGALWERGSKKYITFNNLQNLNTDVQAVAVNIRITEEKKRQIEEMKDQLIERKKMYPPFLNNGLGNIDRNATVKEYQVIQKQIDKLTIPPNEESAAIVRNYENFSGTEEYTMPIPQEGATYEEIDAIIRDLDMVAESLEEKSEALAADAVELRRHYIENNADKEYKSAEMDEYEAESKSIEIKKGLAMESGKGLTDAQSHIVGLFK
ncbi:MAG: hypothetical protein ACMUIP_17955 [bacterium]